MSIHQMQRWSDFTRSWYSERWRRGRVTLAVLLFAPLAVWIAHGYWSAFWQSYYMIVGRPGPAEPPCGPIVHQAVSSPSGGKAVIVYDRGCSERTDLFARAAFARNAEDFVENEPEPFFTAYSRSEIKATWRDDQHLLVDVPQDALRIERRDSEGGVAIEYQ